MKLLTTFFLTLIVASAASAKNQQAHNEFFEGLQKVKGVTAVDGRVDLKNVSCVSHYAEDVVLVWRRCDMELMRKNGQNKHITLRASDAQKMLTLINGLYREVVQRSLPKLQLDDRQEITTCEKFPPGTVIVEDVPSETSILSFNKISCEKASGTQDATCSILTDRMVNKILKAQNQ